MLSTVFVEGQPHAVRIDLAGRRFRYISGAEAALARFGTPERAAAAGIWLSRAFAAATPCTGDHSDGTLPPPPGFPAREPARSGGFEVTRGVPHAAAPAGAIALPAGRAWGDGTHPTTAMALEVLRGEAPAAKSFLDVGSGSGILLVAAARLGIARRAGVEIDAVARAECEETLAANGAPADLFAAVPDETFDFAVLSIGYRVNAVLLPEVARVGRRLYVGALRAGDEETAIVDLALGAARAPLRRVVCRAPPGPPGFGTWVGVLFATSSAGVSQLEVAPPVAPPRPAPPPAAPDAARLEVLDPPLGTRLALRKPGGEEIVLALEA